MGDYCANIAEYVQNHK
ncbi:MAG: hypothetical protein IJD56_07305 [Peptococcaceae bacterium]|nr:hypothetical protein [Peptococcaceae bacterium]